MLDHEQAKNKSLKRNARVVVKNQMNRSRVTKSKKTDNVNERQKRHSRLVTNPVNIRTDNHVRNYMSALVKLGYANSNKNLLENLVDENINKLDEDERKRFDSLIQIYERKDYLLAEAKRKS